MSQATLCFCSSTEGVVRQLFQELHAQGRLFSKREAMCQIQARDRLALHHFPVVPQK